MLNKKNKKAIVFLFLGLYLLSAGISYAVFSRISGPAGELVQSPLPESSSGFTLDPNEPKDQPCPLNGALHTKTEKKFWEQRRPLTVMIENHQESRPQSGLSNADIVYEAVAEGGITRFLAVFYCSSAGEIQIGPVRSARTYFLDWASEYADYPLYAHVGGANCNPETGSGCLNGAKADAIGQIADYGWTGYNDLSQFSLGFPTFWRDYDRLGHPVATEHTMYSTTTKLWEVAEERGLTNVDEEDSPWNSNFESWQFEKDAPADKRGNVAKASFNFWSKYGDYAVVWDYNREENAYYRTNGGTKHIDLNNDRQLTAKNIVVQFQKESNANDGYPGNVHLLYGTIGKGKALVFTNGQAIESTWEKDDRQSRTKFFDENGKEIKFAGGQIWIETLPVGAEVEY